MWGKSSFHAMLDCKLFTCVKSKKKLINKLTKRLLMEPFGVNVFFLRNTFSKAGSMFLKTSSS